LAEGEGNLLVGRKDGRLSNGNDTLDRICDPWQADFTESAKLRRIQIVNSRAFRV
jgi:hypothetical protein